MPRKELDAIAACRWRRPRRSTTSPRSTWRRCRRRASKQQLKSAKGQLTSAKGKYEGAAAQLAYSEIRSPINGVVTDRPSYPGETPAPGTPLLTVMDTSSVIGAHPYPAERGRCARSRAMPPRIQRSRRRPVAGKVTLVSPALDPNSTTVEVWVEAAESGRTHCVRAPQSRSPWLREPLTMRWSIPASAVLKSAGRRQSTVMIVIQDRAHQVAVETGIRQGDRVQITKGLRRRRDGHRERRLWPA